MMRAALFLASVVSARAAISLTGPFEVVLGLPLRQLDKLEMLFWKVADPTDKEYLQHRSVQQLAELVAPAEQEVGAARDWLVSLGASDVVFSDLQGTVTGSFTVESTHYRHNDSHPLAKLWSESGVPLKAAHAYQLDFAYRRGGLPAQDDSCPSLPVFQDACGSAQQASSGNCFVCISAHASLFGSCEAHTVEQFCTGMAPAPAPPYSVAAQKQAYGMPLDLEASNPATSQMVWGPGTFGYSKMQLAAFKASESPHLNMAKITTEKFKGKAGGDNYGEGNLDVRMIASFGLNVSTIVSNTNTSMACEEGDGFGLAMLDFVTELAARPTVPQVLSLSLGSLSAASCDLLCTEAAKEGADLAECRSFLQKQRQVCMFTGQEQVGRINVGLQMLGLRGVSIFGSSGDGGSHWSFQEFSPVTAMGRALNKVGCEYMFPIFPSPSPYMMSVGGTSWAHDSGANPVAWSGSGGGFSWQFSAPAHQKASVGSYLQSTEGLPPPSSFNKTGRGYPDLSAVAVMGTSESSPTVAGIWSMIMDHRMNNGLKPLGFLAPRLWQTMEQHPGVALENVAVGDSKTSCNNGFPSSKSAWDPVTGWGRPKWAGMLQLFGSD